MEFEKIETNRLLVGIFVTGVITAVVVLIIFHQIGILWEFSLIYSTQFISGREFAMLNGASMEIPPSILILISFLSDITTMLVGLPIFVLFHKELKSIRIMAPFMNFSETITSNKSGVMHKFGLVGLFIICFIPFQMTGALATSCFAKLLGFSVKEILPVVSLASLIASIIWALTANTLMNYLGPVQHFIPFFIVFVVIFILVYNFTHYKNK